MKKSILCLMLACMMILLAACSSDMAEGSTDASHSVAKKGVYVSNRYDVYVSPDIPMPQSELYDEEDRDGAIDRLYKWTSDQWGEDYLALLKKKGYTVKRMMYTAFVYDDNSYLFIDLPNESDYYSAVEGVELMQIACFSQSPKSDKGISRKQAQKIISTNSEMPPVDVTPDGLYEATGGQIFMQPEYSFDTELAEYEDMQSPENEWYAPAYYYLVNGTAVKMTMSSIGVGDIDGDGMSETCILQYGPTSGIFTFCVDVYRDGKPICVDVAHESIYQTLSFTEHDGKLCVLGKREESVNVYDIGLEGGYVALSENGKALSYTLKSSQ